ncbi:MAG: LPS-assembly protein LptD [Planctomycetes bacterium]|nr:LPS-assembly protein LptD [Planctomycetota bacterium]
MRRKIYYLLLTAIYFLLSPLLAIAQEKPPENGKAPKENELSAYINYKKVTIIKEEPFIVAFEDVFAYLPDRTIKADYLIAWRYGKAEEKAEFPFDEIYCEGNIHITMEKDTIHAERAYYNLKNGQGIIKNIEWRTVLTDENGNVSSNSLPLVIRAAEIIQTTPNVFKAYKASVTTCPHGKPHYDLFAWKVVFTKVGTDKTISLYHIIPRYEGIPFLYVPYMYKIIGNDPLIRSLRGERNTRFGFTTIVELGVNINKYKCDENGEPVKDKNGFYVPKRWGDLSLENDYYRKRGMAWKPELEYRWNNYYGKVGGFYIRDKGPDPDNDYDRQFLPMEEEKRWRVKVFNRHYNFLGISDLRYDVEYSGMSDRNVLLEYFEQEAREDKEQETYAYLRWTKENTGLTFLERPRINDFQTQTEYLPQIKAQVFKISKDVFLPLYFSSFNELSNIRRRFDEIDPRSNILRLIRFDSLNELSTSFGLRSVNFTPFASGRFTTYENGSLEEGYKDRFIGSQGIRTFSQFHRFFNTEAPKFGIDKIHHLLSLDIRYSNNMVVTSKPAELIQYDNTDKLDYFSEYYLEIRNRFETRCEERYFQFMELGLAAEYYPRPGRDTVGEKSSNYLYPMNWITLSPENPTATLPVFPKRHLSNINMDLTLTPRAIFSVNSDAEYNTYKKLIEVMNSTLNITPYPEWNLGFFHHYLRDQANTVGFSLSCSPIDKWWLKISEQYDFELNKFSAISYNLQRDLHEFLLEFGIVRDTGKDEFLFYVNISPKGLFKRKIGFSY